MGMYDVLDCGIKKCPLCCKEHEIDIQFKFSKCDLDVYQLGESIPVAPECFKEDGLYKGITSCQVSKNVLVYADCTLSVDKNGVVTNVVLDEYGLTALFDAGDISTRSVLRNLW